MGSDNGGKTAAVLYTIMASATANQVEPIAYVCDLLAQLSRNTLPPVTTLLRDAPGILPVLAAVAARTDSATPRS